MRSVPRLRLAFAACASAPAGLALVRRRSVCRVARPRAGASAGRAWLLAALVCAACGGDSPRDPLAPAPGRAAISGENRTSGCVDRFDPAVDYFPARLVVEDAVKFSVTYHRSYKVVTVHEPYPGGPAERYVLVQCGAPAPPLTGALADATAIVVPIASMFSASTTHIPLLVDLHREEVLTGVSRPDLVLSPPVVARIRAGLIVGFENNSVVDTERIVASRPSILMTGGVYTSAHTAIRNAGVPVVANTEWLEPTALGRAEWIKYMALFLNEEAAAQLRFSSIKRAYTDLVRRASAVPASARPRVMTGYAANGLYYISGGRSYVAALIRDAGGVYVWADNRSSGSTTVDLETQLRRAVAADIWINGGRWKTRAAMVAEEPRYAEFEAWRRGAVWNYDRQETDTGANDYWTRAVTRPDLVLADLVKIFHPALLPDHQFEWYRQVPAS